MSTPETDWRAAPKVKAWEAGLSAAGCSVDRLEPLRVLRRRDGSLLFALVEAVGRDPEGHSLLPYALLRGPAAVVVPVCRNAATGERRFLMIRQRRIAHGNLSLEFPAGMLDGDLHDPAGVAVRELEEETGIRVESGALTPLWGTALYSSPGLSDESVFFYAVEVEVEDGKWQVLENGPAGHAHEGEHILTTLQTFAQAAARISNLQTLLAFLLHQRRFGEMQ